jgi:hypothetical protein
MELVLGVSLFVRQKDVDPLESSVIHIGLAEPSVSALVTS